MKQAIATILSSVFCLALLVGCGSSYRGVAEKPDKFVDPPKGGPVGADGGGETAPPAVPPEQGP